MTDGQDAFGHAVWDHHHGTNAFEIIERSDGYFAISSGPAGYLAEPAAWPPHELQALERHARGRVLDIGCNAGRHALYLQQRGHDVLGVDVSPLAIAFSLATVLTCFGFREGRRRQRRAPRLTGAEQA